jgi:hypothetical protein
LMPRSPRPRIRDPSVTTVISTFGCGQFWRTEAIFPRSAYEIYRPGPFVSEKVKYIDVHECMKTPTFWLLINLRPLEAGFSNHWGVDQRG